LNIKKEFNFITGCLTTVAETLTYLALVFTVEINGWIDGSVDG